MNDTINPAIETLTTQLRELEAKANDLKKAINILCDAAGKPHVFATTDSASAIGADNDDQFYGQPLSTCIRAYLTSRKASGRSAATVNEIYTALINGNYQFDSKNEENAKRILRITLTKNTAQFHKLPNGSYGLTAWYPNIKVKAAAKTDEAASPDQDNEAGDGQDGPGPVSGTDGEAT